MHYLYYIKYAREKTKSRKNSIVYKKKKGLNKLIFSYHTKRHTNLCWKKMNIFQSNRSIHTQNALIDISLVSCSKEFFKGCNLLIY